MSERKRKLTELFKENAERTATENAAHSAAKVAAEKARVAAEGVLNGRVMDTLRRLVTETREAGHTAMADGPDQTSAGLQITYTFGHGRAGTLRASTTFTVNAAGMIVVKNSDKMPPGFRTVASQGVKTEVTADQATEEWVEDVVTALTDSILNPRGGRT